MKKMKKIKNLLFALVAISIVFASCGKKETITPTPVTPIPSNAITLKATDYSGASTLDGAYVVTGCLTVRANAQLTIKKGAKLIFDQNAGINVEEKGILTIEGDASNVVTLTGKEAIAGYWQGISYDGTISNNNKISYCNIDYAGASSPSCFSNNDEKGAIVLSDYGSSGLIILDHVNIKEAKENGIYIGPNFDVTMKNCNISAKGFPVKVEVNQVGTLNDDDSNNTFSSSTASKNYISVVGTQFSERTTKDIVINKQSVPYLLSQKFSINTKVTINAGVNMTMEQNALIDLDNISSNDNGNLICNGTSTDPIIFKGLEAIAGYWKGIDVTVSRMTLNQVKISDCGTTDDTIYPGNELACISLSRFYEKVAKVNITNCAFSNYGSNYGIQINSQDVAGGKNVKMEYNSNIESVNTFTGKKVLLY